MVFDTVATSLYQLGKMNGIGTLIDWRQVAHPLFFESTGMMESLANWAGDKAKGYLRVMARWTKNKRLLAMVAELDLQVECLSLQSLRHLFRLGAKRTMGWDAGEWKRNCG